MYRHITTAEGWYFVAKDATTGSTTVLRLAAWALLDGSTVAVGLVGNVRGGGANCASSSHRNMAVLVAVPPIEGQYKHVSDMTEDELAAVASKGGRRPLSPAL
jgi:hypothetical protein